MARRQTVRRQMVERIEHEQRLAAAGRQPPRRIAGGEDVLDLRLESPLGRLSFLGKISNGEYEAGIRYRELAFKYLHAIGSPYPFTVCQEAEFISAGVMMMPADPECENWEREYNLAYEALMAPRPDGMRRQRVAVAVKNIAVYEQEAKCDYDVELLKIGLATLVEHFSRSRRTESNVIPFNRFAAVLG